MPNDLDDHDESDTTADEFDAMWDSAAPVDTVPRVDREIPVNSPGGNYWLNVSADFTLTQADRVTLTTETGPEAPVMPPEIVPTAPKVSPVKPSVPVSA